MTTEGLAAYVASQDIQLHVHYGLGTVRVRMHSEDARTLDAATVYGMEVYAEAGMVPGESEIVTPDEARRRYGQGNLGGNREA